MSERTQAVQDSINEKNREDFLELRRTSSSGTVYLQRSVQPHNTYFSFSDSERTWNIQSVLAHLNESQEALSRVFDVTNVGENTGHFVRGGRQFLTNVIDLPLIFICNEMSADSRPYIEWAVFYPGRESSTKDSWRIEFSSKNNQAVLIPEVDTREKKIPSRVHIPNFPYIFERAKSDAADLFAVGFVEERVNEIGTRQHRMEFDKSEVRDGIIRTLRANGILISTIVGENVDVPGAYVGKFAECLSGIGLNVRASDALPEYVEALTQKGLIAKQFLAEKLPKINEGKLATITFELYPLIESPTFHMAMLREMIRSEAGIIFVSKKESDIHPYVSKIDNDFNRYDREIDAYTEFAQSYGLAVNVVDTSNLRFLSLGLPSEEQKKAMLLDLRLIYLLRRAVNLYHIGGRKLGLVGKEVFNRRFSAPLDVGRLASNFGVSNEAMIESLHRIEQVSSFLIHETGEDINQDDKTRGGPMTVLELSQSSN